MEANKKFSYSVKLAKLKEIQDAMITIRISLGGLIDNEDLAAEPNEGEFYGIDAHLSALEKEVDSLRHEVEPMAFFEKKSA